MPDIPPIEQICCSYYYASHQDDPENSVTDLPASHYQCLINEAFKVYKNYDPTIQTIEEFKNTQPTPENLTLYRQISNKIISSKSNWKDILREDLIMTLYYAYTLPYFDIRLAAYAWWVGFDEPLTKDEITMLYHAVFPLGNPGILRNPEEMRECLKIMEDVRSDIKKINTMPENEYKKFNIALYSWVLDQIRQN